MDIPLHVTATDLDTMRRAVLLDPGDDLARLALADALEEAGDVERAEFVRQGVGRPDLRYTVHAGQAVGIGFPKIYAAHTVRCPDGCESAVVRRGLVESVALPLAAFMEHAGELFSRHPIVSVTITDKEPSRLSSGAAVWLTCDWQCNSTTCLPLSLFSLLDGESAGANYKRFDTPELACAALSAACVAYGRREAGLPPLLPATGRAVDGPAVVR